MKRLLLLWKKLWEHLPTLTGDRSDYNFVQIILQGITHHRQPLNVRNKKERKKGKEKRREARKEIGKEGSGKEGKNISSFGLEKYSLLPIRFGSTSFWTKSITRDPLNSENFPKWSLCVLLKFTQELHTLLLGSRTGCPVQGLITFAPVGYIHMWRSRRKCFKAG